MANPLALRLTSTTVTQTITVGAASATVTNPFGNETYSIRVGSTTACYIKVVEAAGGAATASDAYLPANWIDYFVVTPGQKLSAIQATAGGTLSVTEMA